VQVAEGGGHIESTTKMLCDSQLVRGTCPDPGYAYTPMYHTPPPLLPLGRRCLGRNLAYNTGFRLKSHPDCIAIWIKIQQHRHDLFL